MSLTEAVELDAGGGNGVDGGCMQALVVIPYAIVPEVIDQPGIGKKEKERSWVRCHGLPVWTVGQSPFPRGGGPGVGDQEESPLYYIKMMWGLVALEVASAAAATARTSAIGRSFRTSRNRNCSKYEIRKRRTISKSHLSR